MKMCFTEADLTNFKFANVQGVELDVKYTVPDFLIIGPQRTGTTWLAKYLTLHPEVFIPAEKELYFFNYLLGNKGPLFNSDKLSWYLGRFRHSVMDFIRLNAMNVKMMKSLSLRSLNCVQYCSSHVFGEATASYAAMESALISEVMNLNPNVRVLMMVRNPVERAWSHAKKDLVKRTGLSVADIPYEKFIEFYTRDYQVRCGKYSDMIGSWKEYVDEDRFLIKRFSDIATQPTELFDDVCRFIEVKPEGKNLVRSGKIVNATEGSIVPEQHASFLAELFSEELVWLKNELKMDFGLT